MLPSLSNFSGLNVFCASIYSSSHGLRGKQRLSIFHDKRISTWLNTLRQSLILSLLPLCSHVFRAPIKPIELKGNPRTAHFVWINTPIVITTSKQELYPRSRHIQLNRFPLYNDSLPHVTITQAPNTGLKRHKMGSTTCQLCHDRATSEQENPRLVQTSTRYPHLFNGKFHRYFQ
jgi:hypothetical protein